MRVRKRNAHRVLPAHGSPAALLSCASGRISALAPRPITSSLRALPNPPLRLRPPHLRGLRRCSEAGPLAGHAARRDRTSQPRVPPGARARRLRTRDVRARGVKAGGLRKKKGNTDTQMSPSYQASGVLRVRGLFVSRRTGPLGDNGSWLLTVCAAALTASKKSWTFAGATNGRRATSKSAATLQTCWRKRTSLKYQTRGLSHRKWRRKPVSVKH